MKHAFLIIAHDNWEQVKILLHAIDSNCADIFIHVNEKVQMPSIRDVGGSVKKSHIYWSDRKKIVWGEYGILDASISLLKKAKQVSQYDYYHLLSGSDLPLKGIDEIDTFFEMNKFNNLSKGQFTNYISANECTDPKMCARVDQYTLLCKYWNAANKWKKVATSINRVGYYAQKILGVHRLRKIQIYHGSTWWSISNNLAMDLIANEDFFRKQYGDKTFGADEFAIQTFVMNSNYSQTVYRSGRNMPNSNLREIDWKRGNGHGSPHIWKSEDLDFLEQSSNLFGRKFDISIDKGIVDDLMKIQNKGELK